MPPTPYEPVGHDGPASQPHAQKVQVPNISQRAPITPCHPPMKSRQVWERVRGRRDRQLGRPDVRPRTNVAYSQSMSDAHATAGQPSPATRRQEAARLAEEILGDIELGRRPAIDIARRTSRLARLLDDVEAMEWLSYETGGYPVPLTPEASVGAVRSNRVADSVTGTYWTAGLGSLVSDIETATQQIAGLSAPGPSGDWAFRVDTDRTNERRKLHNRVLEMQSVLDRVIGAFHGYASVQYQELRFGSAVESAFEVVRGEVDARIGAVVPGALPMLSGAFENAISDNPEHWSNAASTCRRLLKLIADALRPAGPDKELGKGKTIKMGEENYINRLVDWIVGATDSETMANMIASDLEYLGRRLDAADAAGHKGAHDTVDRYAASRFITGTYLLLGDILTLGGDRPAATASDPT